MPPKTLPFLNLQWRQRKRIVQDIYDLFQKHCPSLADAQALLQQLLRKCEDHFPNISSDNILCQQLVAALGRLRSEAAASLQTSLVARPSISVAQLDRAVCTLPATHQQIFDWGYEVSARGYGQAQLEPSNASASGSRNVGGRPSKVSNAELIALVRETIQPYLKDSERIGVVRRGSERQMQVVQHLTKKRETIYWTEKPLKKAMGKDTFRNIMKIHFPHVRPPRRLTDICT